MERARNKQASLLILTLVAGLLSQNFLIPVMSITSVEDQKNYYSPDPHAGNPPTSSHGSPPHGSGGGSYGSTPPSHGTPSGGGGSYGGTPPYHGTPSHGGGGSYGGTPPSHGTPSHGGGGSYGGTPPSNCGNPPSGGHHDPTPAPPTGGSSGGGGGYYSPPTTPPAYGGGAPPTPFIGTPPTPLIGTPPTPYVGTPPITVTPPTTPSIEPGTPTTPIPGISVPSPPFAFDPNSPPFTCNYWRTHPGLIWGVLGWWGTMGGTFGITSVPGFGSSMSLQQALSNARTDGFGALYREGTASLLNSMVDQRFPFTTKQVRDNFVGAIGSNKAAAAQAYLFKLANEGRLKPRT